jgi:hypothetical protein
VPGPARRAAKAGRHPVHVGITVGVVAGLYAISLAGVNALQSTTNAQLAAQQAPANDAVETLRTAHDEMEASVAGAENAYNAAVADYNAAMATLAGHEKQLDSLASRLHKISGSAGKLKIPVPPVVSYSGGNGSGGGGGSGGGYRSGGGVRVITITRTVSVPGPTHACTTASGKPC